VKIVQTHTEERGPLNTGQFGFHGRHSTTLQCIRFTDHVALHFNKKSTAAIFLDIVKVFATTWHHGLLHKLFKLKLSISQIKLISGFSQRNFRVSIEGEMSTPRNVQAGVPKDSVMSLHIVQYIYK
jgi:hypothetical protein